ncbi:polysaccharide biosynthesis protein [Clostridium sp. AM33-3]|uniref:polysaccharide biosynthesis protein n=1 Tax=Clostridium sp. AM33-3 TaxID=2292304 RepID=UPI000E4E4FDF|nr:polysaccharide biosynthesis protein [Clostridium sp. AM33-3]RHT19785.1 polysaccharide biosynthesis protein [Clostridium sp. AM33-3]
MLFCSDLSEKKRAFLTGTLLLTAAGFLCRLLGFFYRIFLSRTIGAEGLGIYNMVHPVYGICFALCGGSIQTALSQYIAAHESQGRKVFRTGLTISMVLSGILAFLICQYPAWIASHILIEPRCAPYLPVMGLSLPFASFHACANGYCYGSQKSRVPAFSQVAEQVVRMSLVFLIAGKWAAEGTEITVRLAVYGHLIGEIGAASFNLLCLGLFPPQGRNMERAEESSCLMPLMTLALPLMGNRLILNLLAGAEAVWIPNRLQMSGLSDAEAFSVYGILTGMALPFILFPSAITNSIAVLLLPSVAKDQAEGRTESISGSVSMALRYSLYMGILCIGIFVLFGCPLGISVFKEEQAGHCMQILAWLCPFLYLAATMGSILNGLGCTRTTFLQSVAAMLLRLVFVVAGIPLFGIYGYLCGMLISEIFLALAHLWSLKRRIPFIWNARDMIAKPAFFLFLATGIHYFIAGFLPTPSGTMPLFLKTSGQILLLSSCYGVLLLYAHILRK